MVDAVLTQQIITSVLYTLLAAFLGLLLLILCAVFLPKLINKLTPNIDEEKEIKKGNMAVAQYFGQVIQAVIIGLSIIIAAALISGIHGA